MVRTAGLYALNAATGSLIWNYPTTYNVCSSPAVVGGVVYIAVIDGALHALNSTNGNQIWDYTAGNSIGFSSPAVVGGVAYIGAGSAYSSGEVDAVNTTDGTKLWSCPTANGVQSSPAVVNGIVYVGSEGGNVYAFGTLPLFAPAILASQNSINRGQQVSLTSSSIATGYSPYTYQWFEMAPDASSFSLINGATSSSYDFVTDRSITAGTWNFELQVTDSTSDTVTSNTVSISLNAPVMTVIQGGNGSISPGTSSTNYGDTPTFTITPDTGYHISSITANGALVDVTSPTGQSYQFNPISTDCSLTATFAINTYTITVTQTTNGQISPATTTVNYGADQGYAITPSTGYSINQVSVDGVNQGAISSYTFNNVVTAHTITATFVLTPSPTPTPTPGSTSSPIPTQSPTPFPKATPTITSSSPERTVAPTPVQATTQAAMGQYLPVIAAMIIIGVIIIGVFMQRRKRVDVKR